ARPCCSSSLHTTALFVSSFFLDGTLRAAAYFPVAFFRATFFFAVVPVFVAVRFTVRLVAISTPSSLRDASLGDEAGIASAPFTSGEHPRRPLVVIQRPKHAVC